MNWTFNQNGQLVIDWLPALDKKKYALEVIIKNSDNSVYESAINRTDSFVVDLEDGFYKYCLLYTDNEEFINTIDISKIEIPNNSIGNWDHIENIFSICNLRKCAIAHEKQAIEEFLSTCNKKNCNKKSSQQSNRDILLISIFVLEHLISQQRYSEAENILESLSSCNLCDNIAAKKCCCNG